MKILLLEDDAKLAGYVYRGLEEGGHSVDHLTNGCDALSHALYAEIDLAIVDRMVPGIDGVSVVRALRGARKQVPVLMLTALGDVADRVEGLAAGADDYLCKPFHFAELLARITALARRGHQAFEPHVLSVHDLSLDLLARTAKRGGKQIDLQSKELALLEVLMRNAGRVVPRTLLLDKVWNLNFEPSTSILETQISRLRAKIDKPFDLPLVNTVRSMGYTLHGPS
ncbi:winged helix-turn-helix domain-containing protein [Starkeya nomas]|jgi:two-component system OmpR family response regulator|uniref:Transcriptional activator protein CopR n=1 Tax=Starkeya nomas TaxID=2666134 RepID=A0A5S9R5G6_9HYPH|nr:winged helix-turn-helix domain-containing protein [Starkeya nomas]RTM08388.1 MAG: response regulator [Hyphomicrobiales bacterium]CAA0129188.1 Transcriptional activator protein CopR [Starkeya nomas]